MDQFTECQQDLSQLEYFRISNMHYSNNLAYLKKYPNISIQTKKELVFEIFSRWNQKFHDEQLEQCFLDFNIDKNVYAEIKKGECGVDENNIIVSNDVNLDLDIFRIINKSFDLKQEIIFVSKYDLLNDDERNVIIASKYYTFQLDAIKLQQDQINNDTMDIILSQIDFQLENLFNFALVNKNFNDKLKDVYVELKKGQICDGCYKSVFKRSLRVKCILCEYPQEILSIRHQPGKIITCDTCPNLISVTYTTIFYKNKCGPCLGQKIYGTFGGKNRKDAIICEDCKKSFWANGNRIHNFCVNCYGEKHCRDKLGPNLREWSKCVNCESYYFAYGVWQAYAHGRCPKCY